MMQSSYFAIIGGIWAFVFALFSVALILKIIFKPTKRYKADFTSHSALALIEKADFKKKCLMNKCEYSLFRRLESLLEKHHQGQYFRLFSQVSMGEFICSNDNNAFAKINSKRVDFLIINRKGMPTVVIEYQGSGHFQNNAIERDAVKKEACRKAEIDYLEFTQDYDELDLEKVSKILHKENIKMKQEGRCNDYHI
ncbi:DUF2726 domain-containing protein [Avibacterium volantium]|uniref:DUF2726 domain-containing protein n=1 Tax=Avibacterium volantium TaxID=762 RepID=UPI003BF7A0FA